MFNFQYIILNYKGYSYKIKCRLVEYAAITIRIIVSVNMASIFIDLFLDTIQIYNNHKTCIRIIF